MPWGMKNCTIHLFGSSIIEGRIGVDHIADRWYELMRFRLSELFPEICFAVYNGAVGGQSAKDLMAHLDRDLAGHTPDICIVMFGWNNCRMDLPPERRVTIPELKTLMENFPAHLPDNVQFIGVVNQPLIDAWHESSFSPAYDPIREKYGSVDAYHDLEREAARQFFSRRRWPFVDLSRLMAEHPEQYIIRDGIHLSPAGHRLFAEAMTSLLQPMIQEWQATGGSRNDTVEKVGI